MSNKQNITLKTIQIKDIFVDFFWNSRGLILPETCYGLASDIQENGLLSPIMVRYPEADETTKKYCLVYGHRRLTAVALNQEKKILALVHKTMTKKQAQHANIVENIDREDIPETAFSHCVLWTYIRTGRDDLETARLLGISPTEVWKHLTGLGVLKMGKRLHNLPNPDVFQEQISAYLDTLDKLSLERMVKKKRLNLPILLDTLLPITKYSCARDRFLQIYAMLKVLESVPNGVISTIAVLKALGGFIPVIQAFDGYQDGRNLYKQYCDLLVNLADSSNTELLIDVKIRGDFPVRGTHRALWRSIPAIVNELEIENENDS
ncbi:MAG: ParB N-terminal domain-containing protein [Candidatus Bathyarchaeia archaeon]